MSCVCKCSQQEMESSCEAIPKEAWYAVLLLLVTWLLRCVEVPQSDSDDDDRPASMYN